jgi:hypothetical protein
MFVQIGFGSDEIKVRSISSFDYVAQIFLY